MKSWLKYQKNLAHKNTLEKAKKKRCRMVIFKNKILITTKDTKSTKNEKRSGAPSKKLHKTETLTVGSPVSMDISVLRVLRVLRGENN